MKLYFAPGACSLSPHIVASEAGEKVELIQVDLQKKQTKDGKDFTQINPKGQVPVLQTDDGKTLTEGPVIVQYIGDKVPGSKLVPAAGSVDRYKAQEWLNFISTEVHKSFGPMFRPTTPDAYKQISKDNIGNKFKYVDGHLAGKQYLMGDTFTAPDAYLYVMTRWAKRMEMDMNQWPNLKAFNERVEARPKVQEALKAEGLLQ
jgi:glutathione S-transferase